MKNRFLLYLSCALILAASVAVRAQSGTICGNPANKNCVGQYDDFQPYDLIFNTGRAQLGTGTRHESNEFYAVILESVSVRRANRTDCNFVSEKKRRAAQKSFPVNKVFASRQQCRGTIVLYENTSDDYNFMAVYAGASEMEASKILAKAKKLYPDANVRRMRVILDFSDE